MTTTIPSESVNAKADYKTDSSTDPNNPSRPEAASLSMLLDATAAATASGTTNTCEAKRPNITQFWAIRRCEGLLSPAIFSNWEDCSVYVDPTDNDGSAVEFKSFPTTQEATAYAFGNDEAVMDDAQANHPPQLQQFPQHPLFLTTTTPTFATAIGVTNSSLEMAGKTAMRSTLSGTVSAAAASTNKITTTITPIARTKSSSHIKTESNNPEGPPWTHRNRKNSAHHHYHHHHHHSLEEFDDDEDNDDDEKDQTGPVVTPTEMDMMDDGTKSMMMDGDGMMVMMRMGGRNYRRSVNTTYSSGEDEPVEESAGKDPVDPSDDDVLCGRGVRTILQIIMI